MAMSQKAKRNDVSLLTDQNKNYISVVLYDNISVVLYDKVLHSLIRTFAVFS